LISQHTIEENIFRKSKQKVTLQKTVIKQGNFTTDFFQNVDLQSLIRFVALDSMFLFKSALFSSLN
jgi:SNF2 family DNA or RNA helicase